MISILCNFQSHCLSNDSTRVLIEMLRDLDADGNSCLFLGVFVTMYLTDIWSGIRGKDTLLREINISDIPFWVAKGDDNDNVSRTQNGRSAEPRASLPPPKPLKSSCVIYGLFLSYCVQGWTGVGKDFATSVLADHIRTKKRTVHKFIVPLHFYANGPGASISQLVQEWMFRNLSSCAVNLIVVDELEQASDEVLQGLESVLERFTTLRLNSSRIIVVLISSSGGVQINKLVYDHIVAGESRETLKVSDFSGALSESQAQWYLTMKFRGFIDQVIPFLPLEKRHVAQCVEQDIENKFNTCANPHVVADVLDELTFFPSENPLLSSAGCRKVGTKVDLIMESKDLRHRLYTSEHF